MAEVIIRDDTATPQMKRAILGRWDNGDMHLVRLTKFNTIWPQSAKRLRSDQFIGYVGSQYLACGCWGLICTLDAMIPIERAWPGIWKQPDAIGGLAEFVYQAIKENKENG